MPGQPDTHTKQNSTLKYDSFPRCARKQHSKSGFALVRCFCFCLQLMIVCLTRFSFRFPSSQCCCCCCCRATCRNLSMKWIIVCLCYLKIAGILSKRNRSKPALDLLYDLPSIRTKKLQIFIRLFRTYHIRFCPFQHRSLAHSTLYEFGQSLH